MTPSVRFLGAADTVTGSRYLLESDGRRVLIDCGLYQGYKKLRERNWNEPRFNPAGLDAVVLTHAHIDHSGYLPRLCLLGFEGPVYCSAATHDLLGILLPDAGHLAEEDARLANRHGYSRHQPALPLYTRLDAENALRQLRAVPFGKQFDIEPGLSCLLTRAGHILGAACASFTTQDRRITFSGDVGRPNDLIMAPPEPLPQMDYLIVESTYGDRRHPSTDVREEVAEAVRRVSHRGGVLVVPAFAVGRAQHLLHLLAELCSTHSIPRIPIFLDSPMAISATDLFCKHGDDHGLTPAQCRAMSEHVHFTRSTEESKAIARQLGPKIIVSASGMATGGRVLHHLKHYLGDPRNMVLIVGYQAGGTRGRSLADGAAEVKIHGAYVPVRAEVVQVDGLSAHADYAEIIDWLRPLSHPPRRVFVTHGEPNATDAFRRRLRDTFAWDVVDPDDGSTWNLE